MNRSVLSKQINKEQIDSLKNDTKALLTFLQDQNDGTIIYVLEKMLLNIKLLLLLQLITCELSIF